MRNKKDGEIIQKDNKKKRSASGVIIKSAVAVIVLVFLFFFGFTHQVREGDCAIIMRFGAVRKEITEAGLYLKLPYPFETVVTYDNRLQCCESKKLQGVTMDTKTIILESYVIWNIGDPEFYNMSVAKNRVDPNTLINGKVFSATNGVLGKYNLSDIVSLEKGDLKLEKLQDEIFGLIRDKCRSDYGMDIKDLGIKVVRLPDSNLISVLDQMVADRQKAIDSIMAEAKVESNRIVDEAKAEAAEITGKGVEDAGKIRAEAELAVAGIYAEAASKNIELYKFITNLDAIINSVGSDTILVVKKNEYPFNILTEYAKELTPEGDKTVIADLQRIMESLSEEERTDLTNALTELISEYVKDTAEAE